MGPTAQVTAGAAGPAPKVGDGRPSEGHGKVIAPRGRMCFDGVTEERRWSN